jgi:hypothetical protein
MGDGRAHRQEEPSNATALEAARAEERTEASDAPLDHLNLGCRAAASNFRKSGGTEVGRISLSAGRLVMITIYIGNYKCTCMTLVTITGVNPCYKACNRPCSFVVYVLAFCN